MTIALSDVLEADIVGVSRSIRDVLQLTDVVAESDCCVLIEGESGTGKELLARRIHARSPRCNRPIIPVNCAGVTETLFESQFFGHVRGAFTGAEQAMKGLVRTADGGTLFLDEVGEIPLNLQPKLLRVLQDGEVLPVGLSEAMKVDTRFVAATNRCLRQDVRDGLFREDLFYRLNVVRICIPPLRERPEDIEVLVEHFRSVLSNRYGCDPAPIPASVRRALSQYSWPGNVRELISWVERLYATRLPAEVLLTAILAEQSPAEPEPVNSHVPTLRQAEQSAIRRALAASENNQRQAAQMLQVHRSTLARKIQEYSIA